MPPTLVRFNERQIIGRLDAAVDRFDDTIDSIIERTERVRFPLAL